MERKKSRKRFGPQDREELVSKRLKTLSGMIEKDSKDAVKYLDKYLSIHEEADAKIEEYQKKIEDIKHQAEFDKKQLQNARVGMAFGRHSDAIEARHLLNVFQEHSLGKNPNKAMLWSY